jgi:hypothetical protein
MNAPHLALVLVFIACVGGCGITGGIDFLSCEQQCSGDPDPAACMARCGACSGECVSRPPEGFAGPALLWYGTIMDLPPCPDSAPTLVFQGYTDPNDVMGCDPCMCGTPRCVKRDDLIVTTPPLTPETMPAPGHTPGSANSVCPGPGPCLLNGSYPLFPREATVSRCDPMVKSPPVPRLIFSPWSRIGRACRGVIREDTCGNDTSQTCAPEEHAHGFSQCIMHLGEGEVSCPQDYPEKLVLFGKRRDERSCTPCTCGPPTRDVCPDPATSHRIEAGALALPTASTAPHADAPPLPPVEAPRPSRGTTLPSQDPGSCEPGGGKLVGEIKLLEPSTFCCTTRPGKK